MNYRRVMVFAAHPDDELAMAPAMAKLVSLGVQVVIVLMTDAARAIPIRR